MSVIELRGVAKRFGATRVLADVSLTVPAASITAVLGASGSGKTTLLRLVAGFERLDAGTIAIGGRVLDDGRVNVSPQHRGVGYVPQDGALFPHLTAIGNIGFGLPRRERSKASELLDLVGLDGLGRRYPHQLSGGQQQRVALARALAIRPSVVLLDEPFSSLDASLRFELGRDVVRILTETSTSGVLVTHDQDEALALADQIAILDGGRMVACADPRELYHDPPDLRAAVSIGEANVLEADIRDDRAVCALGVVPIHPAGALAVNGPQPSRLLLRPEQLELHLHPRGEAVRARTVELHYHGHDALVRLELDHPNNEVLLARVSGDVVLAPGQQVWVEVSGLGRVWPIA